MIYQQRFANQIFENGINHIPKKSLFYKHNKNVIKSFIALMVDTQSLESQSQLREFEKDLLHPFVRRIAL